MQVWGYLYKFSAKFVTIAQIWVQIFKICYNLSKFWLFKYFYNCANFDLHEKIISIGENFIISVKILVQLINFCASVQNLIKACNIFYNYANFDLHSMQIFSQLAQVCQFLFNCSKFSTTIKILIYIFYKKNPN